MCASLWRMIAARPAAVPKAHTTKMLLQNFLLMAAATIWVVDASTNLSLQKSIP